MGMNILSERNMFSQQSWNLLSCHAASFVGWINNTDSNQWVLTKMLWKNPTGLLLSLQSWIVIWTNHLLMLVPHDAYMYKWCNGNVTQPVGHVGASENHTKWGVMMGVMLVHQEIRENEFKPSFHMSHVIHMPTKPSTSPRFDHANSLKFATHRRLCCPHMLRWMIPGRIDQ